MGNKARRIRSNKFAKKFATLREKAASRLGLTKVEAKVEAKETPAAPPAPAEKVTPAKVEKAEAAPAKAAAPKKKASLKKKKVTTDA